MAQHDIRRNLLALVAAATILTCCVIVAIRLRAPHADAPTPAAELPLPAPGETPFLNTRPDAAYVGSAQCAGCHENEDHRWHAAPHSRAFGPVSREDARNSARVEHSRSGRHYRVSVADDVVRHLEILPKSADGPELVLADLPVKYAIGSGSHAQSFLIERDGHLYESPLTWYASGSRWDMSPGYDRYDHSSFSRLVGADCLRCHTGRVEAESADTGRVRILEERIGCESCHGPGSLHVAARSKDAGPVDHAKGDHTIVNPARLSRDLAEAVCAQCHASGISQAAVRGHSIAEYRPGLALSDFLVNYQLTGEGGPRTVTSHFEQMARSKCYQSSSTLACTTCHPPHSAAADADPVERRRLVCLECHSRGQTCSQPEARRRETIRTDDCAFCHMRKEDTQVPHVAFTDHQIRKPRNAEAAVESTVPAESIPTLVAFGPGSLILGELDRERCLALAQLRYAESLGEERGAEIRRVAVKSLEKVFDGGLRDSRVSAALAWAHWERRSREFEAFALDALADPRCGIDSRTNALLLLAAARRGRKQAEPARQILEEVVRLSPETNHWSLLAESRAGTGDLKGALDAYLRAVEILPMRPEVHEALAALYERMGDRRSAAKHHSLAERCIAVIRRLQVSQEPGEGHPP